MARRVSLTFADALHVCTGVLVEARATAVAVQLDNPSALPNDPDQPIVAVVHAPNAHTADGSAPGTAFLVTTRLPAVAGDNPALVRLAHAGYEP
ncbi:MAG TPA: hypothetical protein VNQ73_18700 [Ilumatobacter sp.]|nr:hypothetical protein [Ilumatobacter sp.]